MQTIREIIRERKALDLAVTTSVMDEEISTAERGALFMDEHFPGWFKRINSKTFDISDANQCVLGQRFRIVAAHQDADGYAIGCEKLKKLGVREEADLGFSISDSIGFSDMAVRTAAWDALQTEWVRLISQRKEAAKKPVPA